MKLWDIAHSRTGDKGNISNISLIAYDPKDYALLKERVTAERVKEHFKGMVKGEVVRYELPNIHALNFVMYAALGGGVTRSLSVDMHGKGLSSDRRDMELRAFSKKAPPRSLSLRGGALPRQSRSIS